MTDGLNEKSESGTCCDSKSVDYGVVKEKAFALVVIGIVCFFILAIFLYVFNLQPATFVDNSDVSIQNDNMDNSVVPTTQPVESQPAAQSGGVVDEK